MKKRGNAKRPNLPVKKRRVSTGDSSDGSETSDDSQDETFENKEMASEIIQGDDGDSTNGYVSPMKINLHEMKWNRMFELLVGYGEEHGHCRVPSNYSVDPEDGNKPLRLGLWLCSQRQAKSKGKLRPDRETRLQALVDEGKLDWGDSMLSNSLPGLRDNSSSSLGSENCDTLTGDPVTPLDYGKLANPYNGDHDIVDSSDDEDDYYNNRANMTLPSTGLLHEDAHDHRWNLHEQRWDTMYSLLLQFCEQNQHCRVPSSYTVPSPMDPSKKLKLGLWLGTQRQLHSKGKLRKDREMKLNILVEKNLLSWGESKMEKGDGKWNVYFNALLAWGEQNGHFNIKERDYVTLSDGTKLMLGRWLDRQRSHYHKNRLPHQRREKIQALIDSGKLVANVSAEDDKRWLFFFEILKRWGDEHDGNCNAPKHAIVTLEDGSIVKIGKWLGKQRSLRKGKPPAKHLRADRFEMMNELVKTGKLKWMFGLECEVRWNMHFDALLQVAATRRNGDCNVPRTEKVMGPDDTPLRLGVWLNKQRENFLTRKLRKDRLAKLQVLVDEGRLSWDYDGDLPPTISKSLVSTGHILGSDFVYTNDAKAKYAYGGYGEEEDDDDEDDDEDVNGADGSDTDSDGPTTIRPLTLTHPAGALLHPAEAISPDLPIHEFK